MEISEALKISKIYLEQVFTRLKVEGIVGATKGPQGGYSLKRPPAEITAYEVLAATETSLFDSTPETLGEQAPYLEQVMVEEVFRVLDDTVKETLSNITLEQLAQKAIEKSTTGYMYYL